MIKPEILEILPGPLFDLIKVFEAEKDPYRRLLRLINCFEWIIKWHTSTTLSYILRPELIDSEEATDLKSIMACSLSKPSLGHWMLFFRKGKELLQGNLPTWLEDEVLLRVEKRHELVKLRNELSHGPFMEDGVSLERLNEFEPVLEDLLQSSCLKLNLVVHAINPAEGLVLMGDMKNPCELPGDETPYFLTNDQLQANEPGISLWPLSDYCCDETADDDTKGLFYFNAIKNQKIEQLSYELPALHRRNTILDTFIKRLPYKKWRLDPKINPSQQRIDELTETFIGREDELKELREFCLSKDAGDRNVFLVQANPGAGKSALMAALCRELTNQKTLDGEVIPGTKNLKVLSYFIYETIEKRPDYFLKSMISSLERELGLSTKSDNADRIPELCHHLKKCLAESQEKLETNKEELVIIIDGLDESESIHQYIPKQIPSNIKLICSGRTTHKVVEEFWRDQDREKRRKTTLGPLNFNDIRKLLETVVNPLSEGYEQAWVEAIKQKSEGNPFYLKMLCEELYSKKIKVGSVDYLPGEIKELWQQCFCRLTNDGQDDLAHGILCLFAVARSPISDNFISSVLDENSTRCKSKSIELGELLQEDSSNADEPARFFYHSRLNEWVQKQNSKECKKLNREIIRACSSLGNSTKAYSLDHLVSHIVELGD